MKHVNMSDVVFLENTRLIYSGINTLYNLWHVNKHQWESITQFVTSQWDACFPSERTGSESENRGVRYQNPLHRFFEFLRVEQGTLANFDEDEKRNNCQRETTRMLQLYATVAKLQNSNSNRELIAHFESLCGELRSIMECEACYLLYSQKDRTELLSTSGFPAELDMEILNRSDFNAIRTAIQICRSDSPMDKKDDGIEMSLADTLYVFKEGKYKWNAIAMVLDFPKYPSAKWKSEWVYIIFQYNNALTERLQKRRQKKELLINTRNVLFLRQHILDVTMQKMYILLTAQRSYQYVPFVGKEQKLRILHLTDLHLQPSKKKLAKELISSFNWAEETPFVDLIVITGDVVQGNTAAGVLEENYRIAEKFIRELAAAIWKNSDGYVRADWQKRIIIIPGNHDYASMNELQSMSLPEQKRATSLGYPARHEGGPMVKFAYYISFICRLLGLDMNELIETGMNELRCYRELGLAVYAINTVAEVSPLRNNKVLPNIDQIKQFSDISNLDQQFPLLLSHHGPHYQPDYLMDRYWFPNDKITTEDIGKWINLLHTSLEEVHKEVLSHLCFCGAPNEELFSNIRNKLIECKNEICSKGSLSESDTEKNALIWDINRVVKALQGDISYSEQLAALYHSLENDYTMSSHDNTILKKGFEELYGCTGFHLSLSGHTHQLLLNDVELKTKIGESRKVPFVEGDLMFSDVDVSFGLVTIDKQRREIKWEMKYYESKKAAHGAKKRSETASCTWSY